MFFGFAFPIVLFAMFATIFAGSFDAPEGAEATLEAYYLAGMIAAAVMTSGFQTTVEILASERDDGTMQRLAVSPMPGSAYLVGKVILVVMNTSLQTLLLLLVARTVFGVDMPNPVFVFAWVLVLGTAAATAAGVAFGSAMPNARSAIASATPITVVLSIFSGSYIPMTELPGWLQSAGYLFPQAWIARGLRHTVLPVEFTDAIEPQPFGVAAIGELPVVAVALSLWFVAMAALTWRAFRWFSR
ncbi:ABC transporter permease [Brevibacterium sp. SMBL_HHYL_HB1]|uniref:ABC transporter permease n=1 Tax=Brevibacterium sp. SMBL_HHYL_HB1 TaxID=2777556 RepID=UPI001BA58EFE|nr:ABC transporter permease [Brevibacterium sp. SMBL_HHYL_HB1]QUL80855.1 ABC transporter permease [Brevibacterium sp. SMBL_HHYL_HB1]